MEVDCEGVLEEVGFQLLAERDNDEDGGVGLIDLVDDFGGVDIISFDDGCIGLVVLRPLCDGCGGEFTTSACGSVGLGDDGGEVVGIGVGSEELEGGEAERAGAEVGDFEG